MINLSIVIPAYNEAKRLPETLQSIQDYFDGASSVSSLGRDDFEVIVVDDGSSDGTARDIQTKKLKNLKTIRYEENRGKGYAVKTGIMAAKGNYILMMDADGSTPITELDALWPHRNEYEVVIGSRFATGSRFRTQKFHRMVMSKIGNLLFRVLFGLTIHDTQCGFKLFEAESAKRIFSHMKMERFVFDMEVLVLAKKFGYHIKEVPIKWQDSAGSTVRAAQTGWQSLKEILDLWRRTKKAH